MTVTPPWTPVDPLGEVLHLVRMSGAFYCRSELSAPWALEIPEIPDSVSFHVVTSGAMWLQAPGEDPIEVRAGDLALVSRGVVHEVASFPGADLPAKVEELPQRFIGEHYSVVEHGGGGDRSRLICAVVTFAEPTAQALIRQLPPVIHISAAASLGPTSIHDAIRLMAAELTDLRPGGEAVTTRLADILVIQAIRYWIDHDPAAGQGWVGALHDPQIGRALTVIHREPGRDWSLERLAEVALLSRSTFAARFHQLVGQPAMSYVKQWRMRVAYPRLQAGESVRQVAEGVGYRSEAAFTRVFSSVTGQTPGSVRRQRQQTVEV